MQRKQTLWLLLSAAALFLTFFIPFGIQMSADISGQVQDTALNAGKNYLLMLLIWAGIALSIATIFIHRNRSLQMRMTLLIALLTLLCGADMIYICNSVPGNKLVIGLVGSSLYLGILFPLISTALSIMAFIGIRKDDQLLKSVDRLR